MKLEDKYLELGGKYWIGNLGPGFLGKETCVS